eukprot:1164778-Karenia_brevis.AAC.1
MQSELTSVVMKLLFIPTSEYPAESPHAHFSRQLKHGNRVGACGLSLTLRMPLIRELTGTPEG